jgi:SHS2 domain-containing protein
MTRTAGFELFDHTADMGIRVFAPTITELVVIAISGLYATIGELEPREKDDGEPWRFESTGDDPALALRDLLQSLIVLFENRHAMVRDVTVTQRPSGGLAAAGRAVPVDEEASAYLREVKAVTYHDLLLRPVEGGYEAELIVDI